MAGETFGQTVRRARRDRGISLRQLSALTHLDLGHLSKIENGKRRPTATVAKAIDDALHANGQLAAIAYAERAPAARVQAERSTREHGAPPSKPDEIGSTEFAEREHEQGDYFSRNAVDFPDVLEWDIGDRDQPTSVPLLEVGDAADLIDLSRALDHRTVGRGQLTAAELACAYLDKHYAQLGPDVVLPKVRSLLLPTIGHLRRPNPLHHHRRLRILAARLAGLRAWLCFDLDQHGEAERWYDLAVSAALDAEEWSLAAWLLGGRSLIPFLRHDHRAAVKHIDQAVSILRNGADNTTRAWVYALHARGRAGMGDYDGFDESSALALTAAERSTEHERRHGMDFVDGMLDLRYYTGTSQLLLRQPAPAKHMLRGSLDSLPIEHTKARAVLTLNLAEAATQTGEIDEAIALTRSALTSASSQPILPILHQARRIRTSLGSKHAAVAVELDDDLQNFAEALTNRRAIGS